MTFEWDGNKAERNAAKHGVSFRMAAFAFDDPYALVLEDEKHSAHERRQWLIGDSGDGVLIVVFTIRPPGGTIRIVSARRANRRERSMYEERKGV
ncbi:MAG: BrnT family toxin [Elusimicrobia bacterium]|nr:BrnT family toxin [Elusimicrobiota bacterium]